MARSPRRGTRLAGLSGIALAMLAYILPGGPGGALAAAGAPGFTCAPATPSPKGKETVMDVTATVGAPRALPQLDTLVPSRTETAIFALG